MKKIGIILVMTILIGVMQVDINGAADHVIYSVESVSDSSAYVDLSWSNTQNHTPIMIVSWSVDKNSVVTVKYRQGSNVVEGFNRRLISGTNITFPTIILLEEDLGADTASKPIFSDLPSSTETSVAIRQLYDRGIINGYPDGTFKPSGSVTRAEFTKMLFLAGEMLNATSTKVSFTDVPADHWAKNYILTLASKEIVNGIGSNKFNPSGTIAMGEVLAILDRSFALVDKSVSYPYVLPAHWSNDYFVGLVSRKIVLSTDSFYKPYTPTRSATRAECAMLLSRVLKTYYSVK